MTIPRRPGRKPRKLTVRTVGVPSDAALAGFARLLLARTLAQGKAGGKS